jgi:hypothetical protein
MKCSKFQKLKKMNQNTNKSWGSFFRSNAIKLISISIGIYCLSKPSLAVFGGFLMGVGLASPPQDNENGRTANNITDEA